MIKPISKGNFWALVREIQEKGDIEEILLSFDCDEFAISIHGEVFEKELEMFLAYSKAYDCTMIAGAEFGLMIKGRFLKEPSVGEK